jgi:hypothetical protein
MYKYRNQKSYMLRLLKIAGKEQETDGNYQVE